MPKTATRPTHRPTGPMIVETAEIAMLREHLEILRRHEASTELIERVQRMLDDARRHAGIPIVTDR